MRVVFADTLYFIALINPQDQWRANAINADNVVRESRLITTETVLIEILNFTAGYGSNLRKAVASFVRDLLQDGEVEVIPHTHELFLRGTGALRITTRQGPQPDGLYFNGGDARAQRDRCANA